MLTALGKNLINDTLMHKRVAKRWITDSSELSLMMLQTGFSDYTAENVINYLTGSLGMPTLPSVYVALFNGPPTSDAGTGGVEVTGNGYARVQCAGSAATSGTTASGNNVLHFSAVPSWIVGGMSVRDATGSGAIPINTTVSSLTGTTVVMSNNAAGGGVGSGDQLLFSAFTPAVASSGNEPLTTPAQALNTNAIIGFAQATGTGWGTVNSWGLYDSLSGGNLLWWDYLGNFKWLPFTGTLASPSVLTATANGYANGDPVVVTQKYGGTLPATAGSWAGVLTVASATTDTFTAGINTTGTGDGQVRKIVQQPIAGNVTASFLTSTFTVTLA